MRVLRVISGVDPAMGGPPVSSVNSAIAAQQAGVATTVAFPFDASFQLAAEEVSARLAEAGVHVERFLMWRLFPYRARRWAISVSLLRWIIREAGRFEVVHAHGGWTVSTVAALAAARASGRCAVLTPHESLTDFDIKRSPLIRRAIKRAIRYLYHRWFDLIIVSSEMERSDTMGSQDSSRSVVIYHPVVRVSAEPTDENDLSSGDLQIGFLGRLDRKKNADVLIRALRLLNPSARLVVAGDGPLARELRDLADACGVSQRVTWLGFITEAEKPSFFKSIAVLAMPSANECFGVSAAEAMLHAVPVVVSRNVGLAEVIAPSQAGFVVDASPESVAEAITTLLDNQNLRKEVRQRAEETAVREFSLGAHGHRIRVAYEDVIATAHATVGALDRRTV